MFIPIGDDNRDRHITPFVNYFFVLANILVFIFLQDWGRDLDFTFAYSAVPAEILGGEDLVTPPVAYEHPITGNVEYQPGLGPTDIPVYLTLLTSMFMHGGIAHLGGNLIYLWIFGDNIENDLGHLRYFFFYLLCGVIASMAHVLTSQYLGQNMLIPSLGASGAVSGILGAYILMHPRRSVHIWMLFSIISVPAIVAVGIWFVFQVINGMGTLGGEEAAGGVAYAAHIGGFIGGLILVKFFADKNRTSRHKSKARWQ